MKSPIANREQKGFTLIETSIALVFMLIVFVGIAPVLAYAINYNSAAAIRAGALAAAQRKLEQLRATSFDVCTSSSEIVSIGDPNTGSQTYTVETNVVATSPTLKTITIVVTPQGRSTTGGQYAGKDGWKYGQITIHTTRASLGAGPHLG